MSSYPDLTDNVNDSFEFSIRKKAYQMRYPKTSELGEIQKLSAELETVKGDEVKTAEINGKLEDALYAFISPIAPNDVPVKVALSDENIHVLRGFNEMISKELGA
jgi:hypothetical protein